MEMVGKLQFINEDGEFETIKTVNLAEAFSGARVLASGAKVA